MLTGLAIVVAGGLATGLAVAFGGGKAPPRLTGIALDRATPGVSLLDERGRPTSLRAFRGRVVVLAPSLTYCHEVCPITTGALMQVERTVRQAGLSDRVEVLEVSVDPWRDSPARLRAYRRATGVSFRLLTGSQAHLSLFWHAFGVGFYPLGKGKTFDVAHTDGVFFIDGNGRLRIVAVGMPDTGGRLAAPLERLLGPKGLRNLRHPLPGWTVAQALDDLSRLLGRPVS